MFDDQIPQPAGNLLVASVVHCLQADLAARERPRGSRRTEQSTSRCRIGVTGNHLQHRKGNPALRLQSAFSW